MEMNDTPRYQKHSGQGSSLILIHLLMLVSATLVSTSFTVGAAITRELDPVVLTFIRFTLASLIFAPYIYWKHSLHCSLSLLLRSAAISCSLVVFFCCMFLSLRYTTAVNTSVIFAFVPAISWCYARFLLREELSRARLIALVCGLAGAVWVIFRGDPTRLITMAWNRGDLIFLAGCCAMGFYTPLVKMLHRGEPMAQMTFWVLVTGSLWLLPWAGAGLIKMSWVAVSVKAWSGVAYLSVFTTIVTFFLTQYSVPYLGATRVMAYSYLYPGLVIMIDLLLGNGLPPARTLPGVFVVLIAMVVLQRAERNGSCSNGGKGKIY